MADPSKGNSPFYPGQPVPVEMLGHLAQVHQRLKDLAVKGVFLVLDEKDALAAVMAAAEEIGRKHVGLQVYNALKSEDYRSTLAKIGKMGPGATGFTKGKLATGLTESEKRKLANFLQRMKKLGVVRPGEGRGEYVFNVRMVQLYIWLRSFREARPTT
ncbi:MAG: hypothetical protein FJ291_13545 [Planctomycetes bacterium]|nr:hypothetical protein [Planctomycetota bacterium]